MDTRRRQALAEATHRLRNARKGRIEAALLRIDEDEFGYCVDCGDQIVPKRLALDPTTPTCLSCARG